MRGVITFLFAAIGMVSTLWISDEDLKGRILDTSFGLMIAVGIDVAVFVGELRKQWGILKTTFLNRNQPVRVTVAYLFRIEVNGKFILIRRHKPDNPGFQPVGGAFKYLKEETRDLFTELGIEPCNHVPRDGDTDHDLRVMIKKRKKLGAFLKWFESRKNREIDPYREFYEELVEPGLLPADAFRHFKYVFIGKHVEGVLKSPVYPVDELRYAEIYELRPENDIQRMALVNLVNCPQVYFATPEEIRRKSTNTGETILPHTFKIL